MIAVAERRKPTATSACQNDLFVSMLPQILEQAEYAFRGYPHQTREELIQEVVATAYVSFVRLCRRKKMTEIYVTPLTRFAVGHAREGRRTGSRRNSEDLMTRPASISEVAIARLDWFDRRTGNWQEVLVEDRTAGPAETAAIRIDFRSWLSTLSSRDRKLAEALASGETTGRVARMFQISAARVAQLRSEFRENWRRFVGDVAEQRLPAAVSI